MAESHTRQAKRTPVTLKIKFKSATLDQFIERYSVDVSHGGIFIRTKDPLPVGTAMRFEFQLKDASPLITGEGTVVWTREHDPSRAGVAPGMGVRFDRLADGSQEVLDKILAGKAAKGRASKAPVFNEVPTRVAPSPLVAGLAKESEKKLGNMAPPRGSFGDERTDATPLPTPMPFHSDADDFPDEAFEEATKVRSLDELVAASAISDDDAADLFGMRARYNELTSEPEPEPEPAPEPAPVSTTPIEDELAARRAAKEAAAKETVETSVEPVADEAPATAATAEPAQPVQPPAAAAAPEPRHDTPARAIPKKRLSSQQNVRTQKVDTRPEPAAATATPVRAADEPSGSGFLKFAVAAILLCAVGAGGYYMYTKSKEGDQVAKSDKGDNNAATNGAGDDKAGDNASKSMESATGDTANTASTDPEVPAVPKVEHTIAATEGAQVALSDGSQRGPAPMTFSNLDEGKEYTARVTMPGYVAQEVTFVAGKDETPEVELVAMERMLRVTSDPPGAIVYVDGIRQPGVAPVDIKLVGRLSNKDRYKISLRLTGHEKLNEFVEAGADAFVEESDMMVVAFAGELKKKAVVINRPEPRDTTPKDTTPKDTTPKDTTPKDTTPKDTTPKDTTPKDTTPKDTTPKDTTPKEPTPDWMKNE